MSGKKLFQEKRVVVGMSGGVDSSLAAALLKQHGWRPVGVSLRLKNGDDFNVAKKVCRILKIPHHVVDARREFQRSVLAYFLRAYKSGRTPNPCVVCNPQLKFKKLLAFANQQDIPYVATGHYARIQKDKKIKNNFLLLKGKDKIKDQSYYLSFLTQRQLARTIFPLGGYTKKQVYQLAKQNGLDFLQEQKQSQDFCFLQGIGLADFLKSKISSRPGKIVDLQNKILGDHQGLFYYTLGQRQGIGLSGGPYYVVGFDRRKNYLVVSRDEQDLYRRTVFLKNISFISGQLPSRPINVTAKIRYQHAGSPAKLIPLDHHEFQLIFRQPARAVTPGQFAVFYQGDLCLGGGVIV